MGIPAFTGCTKGSYCSDQQATKVGNNQTQIYHRTVTTLTGQGPAYSGSKTETYIIKPNAAGVDTWVLAATSTDGGKTQTFTSAAGADLKKSMAPGGNMYKNTQKQVQDTLTKGGAKQGLVTLPGTSGSLEKITPEQQKNLGIVSNNTATGSQTDQTGGLTPEQDKQINSDIKTGKSRKKFPGTDGEPLKYPLTLKNEFQDVIKFSMVEFRPRNISNQQAGAAGVLNPVGGRKGEQKTIGVVVLPIPSGISDTNAVTWAGQDLDPFKAMGVDIAQSGIVKGLGAAAESTGQAAQNIANNSGDAQKAITSSLVEAAVGVNNLLSRTEGAIQNPNLELLFQAPTLRPFSFTFKLSAREKTEAEAIRKIIRFFKQGMSPIRTDANLFLKAPHTFQLQYLHKGKPHNYLNRFKECALNSFTVDYTPEGQYATFSDGAMVSYQITMQFTELEPVFSDDYSDTATGGDGDADTQIGY